VDVGAQTIAPLITPAAIAMKESQATEARCVP
jgi:hypothetical protein